MNAAVVWTFFWWQGGQNQRLLHEKASRLTDVTYKMTLETSGRKELIRWLLSWMPEVKVLAP